MSSLIVDIVNFNADASCFSSAKWLEVLEGGGASEFCRWLSTYVEENKKVSLGLIGATVADIKAYNPEAIKLINENPDIFEIILRPWAHDIGVYRSEETFIFNVSMGLEIIKNEFNNVSRFFLPPEFMINSKQIELLDRFSIEAIFINSNRYDKQTAQRVPPFPYFVLGTSGKKMGCISIDGESSKGYLQSIQRLDCSFWNNCVSAGGSKKYYSWRDGESVFLIPDGVDRERFWLSNESKNFKRVFLSDLSIKYSENEALSEQFFRSYPIHSFLAWMKEMKMLWFVQQVSNIEKQFCELSVDKKRRFIHLINSDILSSVEKKSPVIDLRSGGATIRHTIYRQEKGFEGEQLLSMYYDNQDFLTDLPLIRKISARNDYLVEIIGV